MMEDICEQRNCICTNCINEKCELKQCHNCNVYGGKLFMWEWACGEYRDWITVMVGF